MKKSAKFEKVLGVIIILSAVFFGFGAVTRTTAVGLPVGGVNASIFTFCTCGPGYLSVVLGAPGSPSGLYYFGPAVVRYAGTGLPTAFFIGTVGGPGLCWMNAGPACFPIPGLNVLTYGGSN